MNKPDKNIPITVKGTYCLLRAKNTLFDWERYAQDLEKYYESQLKAEREAKEKAIAKIRRLICECEPQIEIIGCPADEYCIHSNLKP